jgi:hypothetical protein
VKAGKVSLTGSKDDTPFWVISLLVNLHDLEKDLDYSFDDGTQSHGRLSDYIFETLTVLKVFFSNFIGH